MAPRLSPIASTGSTSTGTVSVVDLSTFQVTKTINHRPAPDRHGLLGQVPVGYQCL